MTHVRKNFLPDDDQSEFEVKVRAPEGTSLEATFVLLDRISREVRGLSGVEYTLTSVADSDQRHRQRGHDLRPHGPAARSGDSASSR